MRVLVRVGVWMRKENGYLTLSNISRQKISAYQSYCDSFNRLEFCAPENDELRFLNSVTYHLTCKGKLPAKVSAKIKGPASYEKINSANTLYTPDFSSLLNIRVYSKINPNLAFHIRCLTLYIV